MKRAGTGRVSLGQHETRIGVLGDDAHEAEQFALLGRVFGFVEGQEPLLQSRGHLAGRAKPELGRFEEPDVGGAERTADRGVHGPPKDGQLLNVNSVDVLAVLVLEAHRSSGVFEHERYRVARIFGYPARHRAAVLQDDDVLRGCRRHAQQNNDKNREPSRIPHNHLSTSPSNNQELHVLPAGGTCHEGAAAS
jgi:hypothetical protein